MARQVVKTSNPGNQRKIDYYMSAARDFADAPGKPSFRCLPCSSPRCGSILLGEMPYGTGVTGDPLEYLNLTVNREDVPAQKLRKLGTDQNPLFCQFREYLGCTR